MRKYRFGLVEILILCAIFAILASISDREVITGYIIKTRPR